jgi:hypothetical protein
LKLTEGARRIGLAVILAGAIAYAAVLLFALLIEECYSVTGIGSDVGLCDPGVGLGRLPLLICLGTTAMVTASLTRMLRFRLGIFGLAVACLGSLVGVALDGQEELFLSGLIPDARWALASVAAVLAGAGLGTVAVPGKRGGTRILVLLAELVGGGTALWWVCR